MADLTICNFGCSSIDGCSGRCETQEEMKPEPMYLDIPHFLRRNPDEVEDYDEDFKASYQKMMRELERNTNPLKDLQRRIIVEEAYMAYNAQYETNCKPRWKG